MIKKLIVEVYAKNTILDPKFCKGEYKYFNGNIFFGTDGSLPENNFL